MKYNRLTPSPLKCFKLPELNGGTDFNTVRENCLKESLNMWHQSNRLKTRPGVNARDRKSTRLNSSHSHASRMPSSA